MKPTTKRKIFKSITFFVILSIFSIHFVFSEERSTARKTNSEEIQRKNTKTVHQCSIVDICRPCNQNDLKDANSRIECIKTNHIQRVLCNITTVETNDSGIQKFDLF